MRRILIASGAALLLAVGAGLFVALQREETGVVSPAPEAIRGTRTVELVFPGVRGGVAREMREIVGGDHMEDDVRTTVEELIAGSGEGAHPIPSATILRNVFWDGEGEITLSFSDQLRLDHPGGSEAELATLRSLVTTIGTNFPGVDAVRILIEGDAPATLAGHADLSRPLRVADYR